MHTPDPRETRRAELEAEFGEPITLDGLTGAWKIFQRRRGHRHSTDDLLTGWYAATKVGSATRLLDLGSGIGSVGLLALSQFPGATLTAVEAQAVSYRLLCENVAANSLHQRVTTIHGDLRTVALEVAAFDLVTGSPPYFDVTKGVVPTDSQKAHARFELRGDVRDYAAAAKRAMSPEGWFVFCFPTPQKRRATDACAQADLAIICQRDVIPRASMAPLFTLFACRHTASGPSCIEADYLVRDANGNQTEQHARARAIFGMGLSENAI